MLRGVSLWNHGIGTCGRIEGCSRHVVRRRSRRRCSTFSPRNEASMATGSSCLSALDQGYHGYASATLDTPHRCSTTRYPGSIRTQSLFFLHPVTLHQVAIRSYRLSTSFGFSGLSSKSQRLASLHVIHVLVPGEGGVGRHLWRPVLTLWYPYLMARSPDFDACRGDRTIC